VTNVLFVCVQNAGRSQISQALFGRAAGGRHQARSAGSRPAGQVHDVVVEATREGGIDVSGNVPHTLDWGLDDPAGQPFERVREIRDDIGQRVAALAQELDVSGRRR
jgi:arsenate reductase (thioredoxin)